MTDDELMAKARETFTNGTKPIQGKWYDYKPPQCCLIYAIALSIRADIIARMCKRTDPWVRGCIAAWDGIDRIAEPRYPEEYNNGYDFGLRARKEFLPDAAI